MHFATRASKISWKGLIPTKKAPEQITENIVNLAMKLKRNYDVSISGNTERNDQHHKKAADVNQEFKELKVLWKNCSS